MVSIERVYTPSTFYMKSAVYYGNKAYTIFFQTTYLPVSLREGVKNTYKLGVSTPCPKNQKKEIKKEKTMQNFLKRKSMYFDEKIEKIYLFVQLSLKLFM